MAISDLLGPDPLARFEHEVSIERIRVRMRGLLSERVNPRDLLVLRPYVEAVPLRYWDEPTVREVLACLNQDVDRTFSAIECRSGDLHRGLENLHRESPTRELQESYDHGRARELLILANAFLPEYLYLAEHVLGNLAPAVWSVCKKNGVEGKFVLKNAIAHFAAHGPQCLAKGYEDRVRNAIAHGEVRFTGFDIEFGAEHVVALGSLDFLRLYDDLTRTCVSLGLAIELFWLEHGHNAPLKDVPLSLVILAVAGVVTRDGLRCLGGIESTSPLAGRQLHVALATDTKSRTQMLLESCRVARELVDKGAIGYDRFLFEVDSGRGMSSLVIVLPKVLKKLLDENAPASRFAEMLTDAQLLWYDEPRLFTSFRAWSKILKAALRKGVTDVVAEWHRRGLFPAKGCYVVREMRNLSVQGTARVEVRAVLLHPEYAADQNLVAAILKELVNLGRRRRVRSRTGVLDKGIAWRKRPCHVFVHLFRNDGPSRWLQRDGWAGGNVVAIAERIWGKRDHVLVKKPQAQIGKIMVRYEMHQEEAATAMGRVFDLVAEVRKQHGLE